MVELFANSGDPDQMPHFAASDLGLHWLPVTRLGVFNGLVNGFVQISNKYVELRCPNRVNKVPLQHSINNNILFKQFEHGQSPIGQKHFVPICYHIYLVYSDILTLSTLVNFSADDILKYFSQKTRFDFICKLFPMETTCMKSLILFSGKDEKKYHHFVVCWIRPGSGKG